MAGRLDRIESRSKLKPRRSPYWQRIAKGRHVGFRRLSNSRPGTWLARYYDGKDYPQEPLGDFIELAEGARFDAAKAAAEAWFSHKEIGGTSGVTTVKDACTAYVEKLRVDLRANAATDAEGRFRRLVNDDPIGKIELRKLTARAVADWKKRTLQRGTRGTWNRNATVLRAALNLAHDRGDATSDRAWSVELRQFKKADGKREEYLNPDERRRLIANAAPEVRPLLTAMAILPTRPGEIANLRVEFLNVREGTLRIEGKTGKRDVPISGQALAHFKTAAKDKLPSAWLFSTAGGGKWKCSEWGEAVREAVIAAKLPKATCATTLRHSAITDLVIGGLDLFTVSKISGTSILMIQEHYGKLKQDVARDALAGLAL